MDFITIWYIIEHSVNPLTIKNAVFYLKSWKKRFFEKIFDPGPSNSFSRPPLYKSAIWATVNLDLKALRILF